MESLHSKYDKEHWYMYILHYCHMALKKYACCIAYICTTAYLLQSIYTLDTTTYTSKNTATFICHAIAIYIPTTNMHLKMPDIH